MQAGLTEPAAVALRSLAAQVVRVRRGGRAACLHPWTRARALLVTLVFARLADIFFSDSMRRPQTPEFRWPIPCGAGMRFADHSPRLPEMSYCRTCALKLKCTLVCRDGSPGSIIPVSHVQASVQARSRLATPRGPSGGRQNRRCIQFRKSFNLHIVSLQIGECTCASRGLSNLGGRRIISKHNNPGRCAECLPEELRLPHRPSSASGRASKSKEALYFCGFPPDFRFSSRSRHRA